MKKVSKYKKPDLFHGTKRQKAQGNKQNQKVNLNNFLKVITHYIPLQFYGTLELTLQNMSPELTLQNMSSGWIILRMGIDCRR